RTKFDSTSLKVRIQHSLRCIEIPCPFCSSADPPKPIKLAAIGSPTAIPKEVAVVVIQIQVPSQSKLMQVAHTFNPLGRCLAARERRQQQTREDRDDRDHHQQLDKRERAALSFWSLRFGASLELGAWSLELHITVFPLALYKSQPEPWSSYP